MYGLGHPLGMFMAQNWTHIQILVSEVGAKIQDLTRDPNIFHSRDPTSINPNNDFLISWAQHGSIVAKFNPGTQHGS